MKTTIKKSYLVIFSITVLLVTVARLKSPFDILLLDRVDYTLGYIQVFLSGLIAVYVYRGLMNKANYISFRKKIWVAFGIWFFLQFFLGLFVDIFLLTGSLHFPIPFIIEAGAIYRAEFGFMFILFAITVLIAGGAWCSHLCYFGCFDLWAASQKTERSQAIKISRKKQWTIRTIVLLAISILAFLMRKANVPANIIIGLVIIVFVCEALIIARLSYKKGKMIHCTYFCPLGTIVAITKYINPRRIVITDKCVGCMSCTMTCKYSAIKRGEVKNRQISKSCTMCGDCISKCNKNAIEYRFLGLSADKSYATTMGIISIIYALFFTIAMV